MLVFRGVIRSRHQLDHWPSSWVKWFVWNSVQPDKKTHRDWDKLVKKWAQKPVISRGPELHLQGTYNGSYLFFIRPMYRGPINPFITIVGDHLVVWTSKLQTTWRLVGATEALDDCSKSSDWGGRALRFSTLERKGPEFNGTNGCLSSFLRNDFCKKGQCVARDSSCRDGRNCAMPWDGF